jgi:hypothetical protein
MKKTFLYSEIGDEYIAGINSIQGQLLEIGHDYFTNWLKQMDAKGKFKEAIAWMISEKYELYASRSERFCAFEATDYPWHCFWRDFENSGEPYDAYSDGDLISLHKEVRKYFGIL